MDGWSDRGRGRPSPAPRRGAERGPPRPRAATGRGDRPSSSGEAGPCFPAAAARALPQVGARGPREAERQEKLAPSPGFPLRGGARSQNSVCGRSCWQSRANAPQCARDSGWDPNASLHSARSGGPGARQGPLARRSPAASFPISKARDPGLGTLSSPGRAPGGHPAPAAPRDIGKSLGIAVSGPPFPPPPGRTETLGSREPLPIRMTWGIPRESGIQKTHTRSPAQYSQTRLPRRRQGAVIVGRRRACPGRGRGGLPGAAALGAGAQQPPRRRLGQQPGSRAPLRVGGAPRRRAHLTGGPPRRRPPRPAAAHGPPSSDAPGLRPGSARTQLRLASALLPRGLPPAPAAGRWQAGCTRVSGRSSSSRGGCYRPGSHKAPEWSCTRAHTPSQPPPSRPASRLPRRPRSLRALPRAHTLHTQTRRGVHSRAHTCAGGGEGGPGPALGGRRENKDSPRFSVVPIRPAAPGPLRLRGHGAWEPGVEHESWHHELGDGGSLAARPAGGDAPAGSRGTRGPPSAESRLPAPTQPALAGRQRPGTDPGAGFPP